MNKLKVVTVIGTRPEIIRLSSVIKRLESSSAIEHILIHTGQNYDYELNQVFFEDFDLRKPDYFLNTSRGSAINTIGEILINIDPIFEKENPDALLILGDTNSCLASIAAKKRKIPIFHMEAGNRCFDERVPEETNRKIVDHISDINLTYSDIAREYLLKEGILPDRVIKIGSPMMEVINSKKEDIEKSDILKKLGIKEKEYFVFSSHREENIDNEKSFNELMETLNSVAEIKQLPIIFSTHPRTKKMIKNKKIQFNSLIKIMKPLGFVDYIKLQKESKAVISDSGTISEESAIIGFNAVNIRESHERPESMEEAVVIMSGSNKERVLQSLEIIEENRKKTQIVKDYYVNNVSEKVVKIIISYVDYVNRLVWRK